MAPLAAEREAERVASITRNNVDESRRSPCTVTDARAIGAATVVARGARDRDSPENWLVRAPRETDPANILPSALPEAQRPAPPPLAV